MRRYWLSVLYVTLPSAAFAEGQPGPPFATLRTGVVHVGQKLDAPEPAWLGTGFFVDQSCTVVTAKHVLPPTRRGLRLRLLAREAGKVVTHPAVVLHEVPGADIAFLRIETVNEKPCRTAEAHVYTLAKQVPDVARVGAAVTIIGHPRLAANAIDVPVIRRGHLSSVEIRLKAAPAILLDLIGVPGFSGSPVVLDDTQEVVGVVYGPGPTQRGFGFEWATPITSRNYDDAVRVPRIP